MSGLIIPGSALARQAGWLGGGATGFPLDSPQAQAQSPTRETGQAASSTIGLAARGASLMNEKSWKDAIITVLKESQEPLHYQEITERILSRGLKSTAGATPSATVNAQIAASIKHEGGASAFVRVSKGIFALRDRSAEPEAQVEAEVSEDIIRAFGIYWQRELVVWRRRPRLFGRQQVGAKSVDFRVSSCPTVHGENIVLRILDKSGVLLGLASLGFPPKEFKLFKDVISSPYGIVLVTGPTGSGKTTTLYSALQILNKEDVNIMSVEDPVEYQFPGIRQVQVNTKAGLSFALALRSFLRQDPDIVMVGEIRDKETAEIAIQAALTGHLVFSTLHTNDSSSSFTRLIDMGIEPFLVSSSVLGILAQRLVRRVCEKCRDMYVPSDEILKSLGLEKDAVKDVKDLQAFKGKAE